MAMDLKDENGLELVAVRSGSFTMGASEQELARFDVPERYWGRETPNRMVMIAEPFAVAKTPVTVGQFQRFVDETGHTPAHWCEVWHGTEAVFDNSLSWRSPGFPQEDDHPVVSISWKDAQVYLRWLGERTGRTYRLLTDAEFEYAARGGSDSIWFWGDDQAECSLYANTQTTTACSYTSPVGSFRQNGYGLYDMLGNVWEWTTDGFKEGSKTYTQSPVLFSDSELKVIRGGGWNSRMFDVRCAARQRDYEWHNDQDIGFRVARDLDVTETKRLMG